MGVLLLLFVNALLLFHEVAVNRVLCYKKNGTAHLELTFFDFDCFCKTDKCCGHDHYSSHSSHSSHNTPNTPLLCEAADVCFDQPVDGSGMVRNITTGTPNFYFVKRFSINLNIYFHLNDGFGSFFASLPLSKFLDAAPSEYNHVILRC